ncbi:hypothetical protein GLOIN_2v1787768 [Rhizophagus irregularis DAOM 181602=DAOM 197198]|nr:hypothetical protein GLOIN_2v1787768 [Rhizophagus irregularis DAOM 181602=DAOM 197198]
MNSKNLEQLLNINKFLSTTPPPNIHSVQDYVSTINISAVFSNGDCLLNSISLIFNANQMLALQFRLAMVVELMKFSNFYLSQKIFEQDYYFSDIALNSAKNSDMLTTYNKEREYIGEIAYISKPHQFCSIIGLYGLASIILFFKRNSPPSPDQNIDIEMRDVQSDENENIPFNILESEKCMSDGSDIVEFNSNVDDNDGESSSSSSYTTNNEKNVRKKQTRNSQKRITKLDHIKDKRLQNHPKKFRKHSKTSNCLLTEGIRPLTSYFVNSTKSHQISCIGLRDEKHLEYLQRIGGIIHYGGAPRVEVLAKELFPIKFDKNFSWKRLTNNEKIKLENELVARAKWRNDFNSNCIRSNAIERPIPKIENRKFTPKFIIKKNPIFKYLNDSNLNELYYSVDSKQDSFWPILAEKGRQGVFKNKKVFEGLCKVMLEIANREQNNKGNQNLQYTENFANFTTILASLGTRGYELFKQNLAGRILRNIRLHHAQSDDAIINTELCYENMVRFKRFADSLNYNGPVAAMTDNTKLKERLSYSATLGCVIGSTLSTSETKASNYKEIIAIIDKIKVKNAIAKQVRVYLLQIPLPKIPPIVIGLIPNNNKEKAADILTYHQKILEYAAQLKINIISFGSDGAANEFNSQSMLINTLTTEKIIFEDKLYNIKFMCPVFPNIGPIIRIQDSKHGKKSGRNALFSGARLLTLGTGTARYDQILMLSKMPDSVLYKRDVENADRQDDGAAYQIFCSSFLKQVYNQNKSQDHSKDGELIDAYQSRTISHNERLRMAMLAYFFLHMWKNHIEHIQKIYPNIIDIKKNFLAPQTFKIFISLAESLILLILAYRDYYPSVPLCTWIHGSEPCEHFFGLSRQFRNDFTFGDLVQSIPKIMHMFRTHTNASLAKINAEKTSAEGYITNYYEDTIADNIHLTIYPTDDEIHLIIHEAHEQAIAFAKVLEFIRYKNLFYDSTFNTHVLACESDLLDDDLNQDHDDLSQDDDLNQDDDGLEEINKADCELNEISKAAELVSTYNIFNLEKTDDLEQSQIDYIYGQSDKKIIQKSSDIFQTGVLSSGELDISYLISQRRKHEAYSNQRMERIYVAHDSALNLNPNKINNIQNRTRLEVLKRYQNAPALPSISVANITLENPANHGGYAFALLGSKICLVQFLAMYHKLTNYHSYVDSTSCIDSLSYISVRVYIEQIPNIFGCFPIDEPKYVLFSHIPSHLIIYYLGNCENFTENMEFLIVGKKEMAIYNFFNSVIDKLQLIIATKSINDNAE